MQVQPYGPNAGDAALVAARKGPLELREVHFSYPLRQNAPGKCCLLSIARALLSRALVKSRDVYEEYRNRKIVLCMACDSMLPFQCSIEQ